MNIDQKLQDQIARVRVVRNNYLDLAVTGPGVITRSAAAYAAKRITAELDKAEDALLAPFEVGKKLALMELLDID
jgi:hypothetical protein